MTMIVAGLIGLLGSILTYWLAKKREREAEWRKEKISFYKAFVDSLSGIIEGESTADGQRAYARACNNLLLFAPQNVIDALNIFRSETKLSNPNRTIEQHDALLAVLLLEIRRDIGVEPADNPETFKGSYLSVKDFL